jgi:hypothetical protein
MGVLQLSMFAGSQGIYERFQIPLSKGDVRSAEGRDDLDPSGVEVAPLENDDRREAVESSLAEDVDLVVVDREKPGDAVPTPLVEASPKVASARRMLGSSSSPRTTRIASSGMATRRIQGMRSRGTRTPY